MTSSGTTRLAVVTHFPSPYQVELFNEIERQRPGLLRAYYLFKKVASRSWSGVPIAHDHVYLDETTSDSIRVEIERAAYVVFNYYNDARAAQLIRIREASGRPWCFWGERPGYRFPWLARMARIGRAKNPVSVGLRNLLVQATSKPGFRMSTKDMAADKI